MRVRFGLLGPAVSGSAGRSILRWFLYVETQHDIHKVNHRILCQLPKILT